MALCGCLGGGNEFPTQVARSVEFRLPDLKTGDRWVVEESGSDYEGAISTVEVVASDSAYGSAPAYAATLKATIARYGTPRGDSVFNFLQTGLLFMRRSDQEAVYDSVHVESQVRFAGDTGITKYSLRSVTTTDPQGDIPVLMKPGMKWTITYKKTRKSVYSLDGVESGRVDTTWNEVREYSTGSVADVSVKAGLFYAIEIDWTRAETGERSAGWFSVDARTFIKEEKFENSRLTGRYELTSLTLK